MDTVTLHCSSFRPVRGPHPCQQARKLLEEARAAYELAER